jgi:multiple sugar transport system permease protein
MRHAAKYRTSPRFGAIAEVAVVADSVPLTASKRGAGGFAAYHLVAPATLGLVCLVIGPALAVFVIAMTDWQFGAAQVSFVGWSNFRTLFADADFYRSLTNTFVYVLMVVPGTVGLGLAVALAIECGRSFRAFYRAVHFLPFMATLAAMAVAWEALLHPTLGLVNRALAAAGLPTENWLHDAATVLPVLAVIAIWQNLGFAMVLFLAGLKLVPQDLYEAAAIDGADGVLDRLRIVTLPMLGPTTMFVVIVTALRALATFDTVSILTQGRPGKSSAVLLYTLYVQSFEYLKTGYGAAITVVFLLVMMSLTLLQAKIMDRRVHYV